MQRIFSSFNQKQEEQIRNQLLESKFINGPDDMKYDMICLICSRLLLDTSVCCQCEQCYCTRCIEQWVRQGSGCLKCESFSFKKKKPLLYDDFMKHLRIDCPFSQNKQEFPSCPQKDMTLNQCQEHIKNCQFQIEKCPNQECSFEGTVNQLIDHKLQCPYRLIQCQHCRNQIKEMQLIQHDIACPYKPIICKYCEKGFFQQEINDHQDNICPLKIIQCNYCHSDFTKASIKLHEQSCPKMIITCDCKQQFERQLIEEHQKICEFVILNCEKCNKQYTRQEDHQNKDCIKHLAIKCQQIESDVFFLNEQINEIKYHLNLPLWNQKSQYQSMVMSFNRNLHI